MGKNGELWDDSALIKALDDAISKYKRVRRPPWNHHHRPPARSPRHSLLAISRKFAIAPLAIANSLSLAFFTSRELVLHLHIHRRFKIMHGKGGNDGLLKEEEITEGIKDNVPLFDESNEAKSVHVETNDNTTDETKITTQTGEVMHSSSSKKCPSEVIEQHMSTSNGQVHFQDTNNTYFDTKSTEDYNLLLNQYNTIEEQRQKLLEQLYQYSNWDYQGYDYGTAYDPQYHPVPAPQPPGPTICSCRPYVCPYPCASESALTRTGGLVSLDDGGLIKAAMRAADGAFRSFNIEDKEGKKGEKVEIDSGNTSQTNLSVVLDAWYAAGFYTGKYLSEQTCEKK